YFGDLVNLVGNERGGTRLLTEQDSNSLKHTLTSLIRKWAADGSLWEIFGAAHLLRFWKDVEPHEQASECAKMIKTREGCFKLLKAFLQPSRTIYARDNEDPYVYQA